MLSNSSFETNVKPNHLLRIAIIHRESKKGFFCHTFVTQKQQSEEDCGENERDVEKVKTKQSTFKSVIVPISTQLCC